MGLEKRLNNVEWRYQNNRANTIAHGSLMEIAFLAGEINAIAQNQPLIYHVGYICLALFSSYLIYRNLKNAKIQYEKEKQQNN